MTLGTLVKFLKSRDKNEIVEIGFSDPHSYRGYYEQLAFEPKAKVCVKQMLDSAKSALGQIYCGYKGGEYTMDKFTTVNLSEYGRTGCEITREVLALMFKDLSILETEEWN